MPTLNLESNRRLLVIDDTRAIHDDFRKILCGERRGEQLLDTAGTALFGESQAPVSDIAFHVDSAFQGKEGLALVARAVEAGRPYAMAFVDVRMPPGWDGIETIERIWQVAPDLQVVICTAFSDYSWDQMIAKLGHSDRLLILKKPFDTLEVRQLAVALTEKWRLTQQARASIADLETMVRASEEKFSQAFRLQPDALSLHRLADGACIELNPGFTKITGYAAGDTLDGRPLFLDWELWADPKDRERLRAGLQADGEVEGPFRHKNGSLIRCLTSARIMQVAGEACVLAITRDLTVQRRLEDQLAQARKMEAVGQLAGGVAHDYNNVLTATLIQLEFLLDRTDLAPATREVLKELESMAHRSATLTRQLLAFSRQQVMHKVPLDLNDALRNLFTMLRRLLGENIEIDFQFAEAPLFVEADLGMIEQLVTNLCVNARDAMMPRGGRLTLQTGVKVVAELPASVPAEAYLGKFVFLSITDTGCGMDAATLARVFEPFFTTKEVGKGTGLGLATVYGIAQQHRGWVEVESQPGSGTQFRVVLPALSFTPVAPLPAAVPAKKRGNETILLVEDEDAVRLVVATALRKSGYQVYEAGDGRQAVQQWSERAREIDLLFSDMVMPNGMTGLDLAEHFRRANPDLRVVLSSGYSEELNKPNTVNRRGLEFLAKPFTTGVLTDLVRKCLDAPASGTPG
jgi:two-component system cell cycle sensor histidine kinase/response regulator CckA